jgi:hypothetical protein
MTTIWSASLVQEQHGRSGHEAGRQIKSSTHATRVPFQDPIGRKGELESLEEFGRPAARPRSTHPAQFPDQHQVLPAGERPVEGGVLGSHANQTPHLVGFGEDVAAGHRGPPSVRRGQGGQDSHRRGLAGPIGPEQPQDRPGGNRKVNSGQGLRFVCYLPVVK